VVLGRAIVVLLSDCELEGQGFKSQPMHGPESGGETHFLLMSFCTRIGVVDATVFPQEGGVPQNWGMRIVVYIMYVSLSVCVCVCVCARAHASTKYYPGHGHVSHERGWKGRKGMKKRVLCCAGCTWMQAVQRRAVQRPAGSRAWEDSVHTLPWQGKLQYERLLCFTRALHTTGSVSAMTRTAR
jgi:hypothetical protein